VIRSGLEQNDRIVISGAQLAMPGMKVQVRAGTIKAEAAPASAPQTPPPAGSATFATR
jgi:hypothetical protein